jgi:3-oxoacyl-[acyl-carrier protein] reductase
LELAPSKIRVNVVEPGFAPGSDLRFCRPIVERMTARIPLGRNSGPDDTAQMVVYLCSPLRVIHHRVRSISVDGGNSIGTYQPTPTNS